MASIGVIVTSLRRTATGVSGTVYSADTARQHRDDTQSAAIQEALQLRRSWHWMERTPLSDEAHFENIRRCNRDDMHDSPQHCHCNCAGCLGPEPEPEPPVVTKILDPPPM